MTKSQIFQSAHAEAREIFKSQRWSVNQFRTEISYKEAFACALRRIYAKQVKDLFVAMRLEQPEMPKFMFLRGF